MFSRECRSIAAHVYGHGFAEVHGIAGRPRKLLGRAELEHSLAVAKVKTSSHLKAAFYFGDSCVAPDEMGRSHVKTPRFSASDLVCKPCAAVVPKNARGTFPQPRS